MIVICLFTHALPKERGDYAQQTLRSLENLAGDEFWLHVSDDGSSQEFRDEIMVLAREMFGDNTSISNSEGKGYGASYNLSTQITHQYGDLILPLEDDWVVRRPFNLAPLAELLRDGVYRCIRMGYIGFTDDLICKWEYHNDLHYLRFNENSPEKHVFAGGPRLETVQFQKDMKSWPENLSAGQTELEVAGIPKARQGVAWPISLIHPTGDVFVHVGSLKAETGTVGSSSVMVEATS